MKLIATKLSPSEKSDRLRFVRHDGSACEIDMPRQGVLAHDLVHYLVETDLGLHSGFLSLVAGGADARFVMALTHDPKNQEVERGAVQAEAAVEALQTQLWSGAFDWESFLYAVKTAAEGRGVRPPDIQSEARCKAAFERAVELHACWSRLKPYETLELSFHDCKLHPTGSVRRAAPVSGE
jgi:hypothetical protein